jgi:DNA-binding NtrC family response regulator
MAIGEALQQTNWNRKAASRLLKISYKALLYKIRDYGLGENHSRPGADIT